MFECETCNCVFFYWEHCEYHMSDYDHWPECETCDRTFRTQSACDQHMNDKDHWAPEYECETCDRTFRSQSTCNQHMNDTDHWAPEYECETCDRTFRTQSGCNQHMNDKDHWAPVYECETCEKEFSSVNAVNQHMRDTSHFKAYCSACDRHFQNENNLRMHLNSSIHRGKTMICPFCKANYTTTSGLSHHLEGGSCPRAPMLNRESIYKLVNRNDPTGIITKKQIKWHKEDSSHYSATRRAFNGTAWECYICHTQFYTAHSLDQHVNSPVHKQNLYHCPNKNHCGKEFVMLAALFNHLESESCQYVRFDNVNKGMRTVFQGRALLAT